jgi:putative tryptophan/tyrosine transport system substrate-binding protein
MKRREVSALLGVATAWPPALMAQITETARRIGVLSALEAENLEVQERLAAFRERLAQLGWIDGRNLRIDYRWGADGRRGRDYAAELVALGPEVILAAGGASLTPLLQITRTLSIVFANVPDPIGAGFVESLARPGGNATGFLQFEYSLSSKWPELLKEIAPGLTRAAVARDATTPFGIGQFAVIQSVAPSLGIEVSPINLHDADQTQRAVASFFSPGGLEGERVSPLCMRPEAGRRLDAVLAGSARPLAGFLGAWRTKARCFAPLDFWQIARRRCARPERQSDQDRSLRPAFNAVRGWARLHSASLSGSCSGGIWSSMPECSRPTSEKGSVNSITSSGSLTSRRHSSDLATMH